MSTSAKIVDSFRKSVEQALNDHQELLLAIHNKHREVSLEIRLVEQFVMSTAVLWESFISELLLSLVTKHPQSFLKGLASRVNQSVSAKFGNAAARNVHFARPNEITRGQALGMLDPTGSNITASSAEELSNRANQMLTASKAKKFSLGAEDRELIDLLISVRNYLAHRSKRSRAALKVAISNVGSGNNAGLGGKLTTVGTYLRRKIGHDSRATFIARRLMEISKKLR